MSFVGRTHPKRHIYHLCVAFNGVVKTEHQIGRASKDSVFVTFRLDNEQSDLGSDADDLSTVHRSTDHARHCRTVSVLVLDQRPIVGSVFQGVVFDDLVLSRVVGILTDTSRKFGMVSIDSRINDGHRYTCSLGGCPSVFEVDVIQIGLQLVGAVGNGVLRSCGDRCAVL